MRIKDVTARGQGRPGGLRGVLGVLAITWGTMTVGKIAADAAEKTDAAEQHLELIQPRLAEARAELKDLDSQIGEAKSILRAEVVAAIREGHFDPHVKARANTLADLLPTAADPTED
jgi:hypothetical protein